MTFECENLVAMLNKYEEISWDSLTRYIAALSGTALALLIVSMASLAAPRSLKLGTRPFLLALFIFQLSILITHFVLDARRDSMIFTEWSNPRSLTSFARKCELSGVILQIRSEDNFYRFPSNSATGWYEPLALLATMHILAVLAVRLLYISLTRASNDNEDSPPGDLERRRRCQPENRAPDICIDIDGLLLDMRYEGDFSSQASSDKEEVCAICLEEITPNPAQIDDGREGRREEHEFISQLDCSHFYHENCLRTWLRATNVNGYSCPVCKAHFCADDGNKTAEENDADEEAGGVAFDAEMSRDHAPK